jgi:hypothetical protein
MYLFIFYKDLGAIYNDFLTIESLKIITKIIELPELYISFTTNKQLWKTQNRQHNLFTIRFIFMLLQLSYLTLLIIYTKIYLAYILGQAIYNVVFITIQILFYTTHE